MAAWATTADVAAWVGVAADSRMTDATNAALAWANRTRPDLDPEVDPPFDVHHAVVLYAGLLYKERVSPAGFDTYAEVAADYDVGNAMTNIYRLIGSRKPVAR